MTPSRPARAARAGLAAALCCAALSIAAPVARAQGAPSAPPKAATCAACHGPNGNSTQPQFPVLAGQTSRYLYLELRDFQEKRRVDPVMSPMAEGLTRDEMRALADWFAAQKPAPVPFKA